MKTPTNLLTKRINNYIDAERNNHEQAIAVMVTYIIQKINEGDWHGVADAAMDIREYEARSEALIGLQAALIPDV